MEIAIAATLKKSKALTFENISNLSGVGLRTVKRYFSQENITSKNEKLIDSVLQNAPYVNKKLNKISHRPLIDESVQRIVFPKSLFSIKLFWSSPIDTARDIDGVIQKYIESPNLDDLYTIYKLFGSKRVKKVLDNTFKNIVIEANLPISKYKALPEYKSILLMLKYFEARKSD
jgi:hypothetical protein